jgi:dTDP-4-dehydrorhamnose 3,5-epimerase
LSDVADFQYKCSDIYHPKSEKTIRWDDPAIGIDWPRVEEDGGSIVLSEKDAEFGRLLVDAETFE